jgi:hypothetical protein
MGSERWDEIGYTRGFAKVRQCRAVFPCLWGSKPISSMPFFVLVLGVVRATSGGAQIDHTRLGLMADTARGGDSRAVGESERNKGAEGRSGTDRA